MSLQIAPAANVAHILSTEKLVYPPKTLYRSDVKTPFIDHMSELKSLNGTKENMVNSNKWFPWELYKGKQDVSNNLCLSYVRSPFCK